MRYYLRIPRQNRGSLTYCMQDDYVWDLLEMSVECHPFVGTVEQCQAYRDKVASILRNVADEVDRCDIVVDESTLDKPTGCTVEGGKEAVLKSLEGFTLDKLYKRDN